MSNPTEQAAFDTMPSEDRLNYLLTRISQVELRADGAHANTLLLMKTIESSSQRHDASYDRIAALQQENRTLNTWFDQLSSKLLEQQVSLRHLEERLAQLEKQQ